MRIKNYVKKTMGIAALMAAGVIFAVTGTKAAGPVAINEVNFPDNNFRAYVSAAFDTDKNGILSDTEISKATTINVRDRGIFDMTGIAVFTELAGRTSVCLVENPFAKRWSIGTVRQLCIPAAYESKSV